jgi:hypothetical protein
MEKITSGSLNPDSLSKEEIEESLDILMKDDQFEQDLINSFNDQMYIIKETAPNPIWTLCSITMKMVRILPRTEIIPIDEWSFPYQKDENLIECLSGTNLVKIPKKYVKQGEWH